MNIQIPVLFVPSFYGDIKLEADGPDGKQTVIIVERATPLEQNALTDLAQFAAKKRWLTPDGLRHADGLYRLDAPLEKVQKELVKRLKPNRTMITAVVFRDGGMAEVRATDDGFKLVGEPTPQLPATPAHPGPALREADAVLEPEKKPAKKKEAKAATTVAMPTQGCPAPDFVRAEIKARAVLNQFLNEEQREDFAKHNRFVSVGAQTGHRYMVTSRHNRQALERYVRSLYDLDEQMPYCVHDWAVPAAEEVLGIHLLLQLPQHEGYLRHLH